MLLQIGPRAVHVSPATPVGQGVPGVRQSPPLTAHSPAGLQVVPAGQAALAGLQAVAGSDRVAPAQTLRTAQIPPPGAPPPVQSTAALQVRSPAASGKNCSPIPSPAERVSVQKVCSARRASCHFDRAPADSFIDPEVSTSSSRSTGA